MSDWESIKGNIKSYATENPCYYELKLNVLWGLGARGSVVG
jgi:hypothetical protein